MEPNCKEYDKMCKPYCCIGDNYAGAIALSNVINATYNSIPVQEAIATTLGSDTPKYNELINKLLSDKSFTGAEIPILQRTIPAFGKLINYFANKYNTLDQFNVVIRPILNSFDYSKLIELIYLEAGCLKPQKCSINSSLSVFIIWISLFLGVYQVDIMTSILGPEGLLELRAYTTRLVRSSSFYETWLLVAAQQLQKQCIPYRYEPYSQ